MTTSSKRGRGPIRKLTKEVEEIILRHLRAGAYFSHACEAAGIRARTVAYWLEWGEEGKKPYAAFADKVMQLRAEDAIRSQSIITRAQLGPITGDWKAAAWSLERKHPKVYGAAAAAAAAVSVRTGGGAGSDGTSNDSVTTVQFYLPDNGRRPPELDGGEA